MYCRYVDDTFAVFHNKEKCNEFLAHLNSSHSFLRFTVEKENNGTLPFLDVLVGKSDSRFITSARRKLTFAGECVDWKSFCSKKRKIDRISTLVHRVLAICSQSILQAGLIEIRSIFRNNGYPYHVVNTVLAKKSQQFHKSPHFGSRKCPWYLHIPWLRNVSTSSKLRSRQLLNAVSLPSNLV